MQHLRRLLPSLVGDLFNQRLRLVMLYIFSVMAAREQIGGGDTWDRLFQHPASHENFVDTIEGMLTATVSPSTLVAMAKPRPRARRS